MQPLPRTVSICLSYRLDSNLAYDLPLKRLYVSPFNHVAKVYYPSHFDLRGHH